MCVWFFFFYFRTMENDILRLNIPKEPHLDPNTVCKTYPELTANQYNLCRKYPDVTASAIQGVQIAIHECQFQLRTHRWNCSSLETKNKNPHSSPLLAKGKYSKIFIRILTAWHRVLFSTTTFFKEKRSTTSCDVTETAALFRMFWHLHL